MTSVNQQTGVVEPRSFPLLGNWQRKTTLDVLLMELRREMASPVNRRQAQPPEGTMFEGS